MNRNPSLALTLSFAAGSIFAAGAFGGPLRLQTGQIDAGNIEDVRVGLAEGQKMPRRLVVQMDGPMDSDRRAAIEASGARIIEYIPDNAFVLDMRGARLNAITALPFVDHIVNFRASWKISPELGQRPYTTPEMLAITDTGALPAVVMLFSGADLNTARAELARAGLNVLESNFQGDRFTLDVVGTEAALRGIAQSEHVQWVEPAPEVTYRNSTTRWVVQSNSPTNLPVYDAGIHGEGQIIGIMDLRVTVGHCTVSDPEGDPIGPDHRKILAYNASIGTSFHGSHVAGTAVGDAGNNSDTRGVAYGAQMVYDTTANFGSFNSMNSNLTQHYNQGAAIHTNSWGNDGTTAYDNWTRAIDTFSFNNDDNLVIFAVTNGGSLKNPENAKNCLAVGASQDANSQQNFCSGGQGPTNDGRRKPEIYAPGCGTRSANGSSGCSTAQATGTSMAAPAIAGAAALARQYYMDGFYPTGSAQPEDAFTPSGPLLKATLLNSSVDMTGVAGYPSNREGWGRILLDNALYLEGQTRFNIVHDVRNASPDALNTGDVVEIPITVNSNAEDLVITMAFHDAPAATNASFAAVNDLDLELVTPLGFDLLGNVFSGGQSNSGGSPDPINNVEMIRFVAPFPGEYVVRVRGTAVNQGTQGFAVVITGDVAENSDPGCSAADIAEPFGTLNFFDISAYITAFNAGDDAADLAAPFGTLNFFDISAYIGLFNAGCP